MIKKKRSPIKNMLQVWHALFLRQILDRWFGSRAGWAWQLLEPMCHIGFMVLIYAYFIKRPPGSFPFSGWFAAGITAFFVFQRTAIQTMHALDCNKPYFAFHQVRPFDAAFMRGSVEGFSGLIYTIAIMGMLGLMGQRVLPDDILNVLLAFIAIWFLGVGWGLITSVLMRLVPDLGHIFSIIMLPLYILSGVFMAPGNLPEPFRSWMLYNPIAHGLELVRKGFYHDYHAAPAASMAYLVLWGFILWLIGLALYKLMERRLVMA